MSPGSFLSVAEERGFIVLAPHNLYGQEPLYRQISRKGNTVKLSMFSMILRHHQQWLAWLASWGKLPWLMLQVVYLPMLFPEGRPFKRWGWLLWAAALTALVGVAGEALDPDLLTALKLRNPLAVPDPNGYLGVVGDAAEWMLIGIAIAALASVFIRLKRATGEHRQQLKWVGAALALLVTTLTGATVADATSSDANFPWLDGLVGLAFLTVPVSVAFAVLPSGKI